MARTQPPAQRTGTRRSAARTRPGAPREKTRASSKPVRSGRPRTLTRDERAELERLRQQVTEASAAYRWNADPDDVQRSLAQFVLTLVEFLRRLMERQALRRFDAGSLTDAEAEDLGRALMQLENAIHDMAQRFGLDPADLNLDLGPIGTLM